MNEPPLQPAAEPEPVDAPVPPARAPRERWRQERRPRTGVPPRWERRLILLLGRLGRQNRFTLTVAGVVAAAEIALISAYLVTHGSWPTPDVLVLALLPIAIVIGRPHWFLLDWGLLLGLWLLWQMIAGIVDPPSLDGVKILEPVEAELWLFDGVMPNLALQQAFFRLDRLAWWDWLASMVHAAHFAVPIALGFLIWLKSRALFWRFAAVLLVTSYIGLFIYWRYPAAPPWLASDLGTFAPHSIWRILGVTFTRFPVTVPIGWVYQQFSPNEVAAIPSLHAALPVVVLLTVWRVFPRWTPLAMLYLLVMNIALVYLGEHYVLDELVGAGVALVSFLAVWPAGAALSRWWSRVGPQPARWSRVHTPAVPPLRVPRWWEAVRAVVFPGIPLVVLLWFLWGPLDLRPIGARGPWKLNGPLMPPACSEQPGETLAGAEEELSVLGVPAALFVDDLTSGHCYVADPAGLLPYEDGRALWLAALERAVTWNATADLQQVAEPLVVHYRTGRPPDLLDDPAAEGRHIYGVVVLARGDGDAETLTAAFVAAARRALAELTAREGSDP
jgi:hypothetical protein